MPAAGYECDAEAPEALVPATAPPGFDIGQLTNVSAGAGSVTNPFGPLPPEALAIVTEGFHRALTIAIANSIWLGVGAAVIAVIAATFLKEIPLRTHQTASSFASPEGSAAPLRPTPASD